MNPEGDKTTGHLAPRDNGETLPAATVERVLAETDANGPATRSVLNAISTKLGVSAWDWTQSERQRVKDKLLKLFSECDKPRSGAIVAAMIAKFDELDMARIRLGFTGAEVASRMGTGSSDEDSALRDALDPDIEEGD